MFFKSTKYNSSPYQTNLIWREELYFVDLKKHFRHLRLCSTLHASSEEKVNKIVCLIREKEDDIRHSEKFQEQN